MKPIITKREEIEGGHIILTMQKELYFSDLYYIGREDKESYGDMGFNFCDQADTRNDESLNENIANIQDGAISTIESGDYDFDREVMVYEVHKALFEVVEDCYPNELDGMSDDEIIENYWTDYGADMVDDTEETCYAIALCDDLALLENYQVNEVYDCYTAKKLR